MGHNSPISFVNTWKTQIVSIRIILARIMIVDYVDKILILVEASLVTWFEHLVIGFLE